MIATRTVGPPRIVNIADLRRAAKLRLPRVVFDYIDGGAEQELTMGENVLAYEMITFLGLDAQWLFLSAICERRFSERPSSLRSSWPRWRRKPTLRKLTGGRLAAAVVTRTRSLQCPIA